VFATDLIKYIARKLDFRQTKLTNLVNLTHHHLSGKAQQGSTGKVSIIIPTRDKPELLRKCIDSILEKTKYQNFEILVVDNQSSEPETFVLLEELEGKGVKILHYPSKFNFSAICNLAASQASSMYLCFLNNDTEITEPNWLSNMVEHANQPNVGVVGAVLRFPDGKLQHMGIALNFGGVATHPFRASQGTPSVPTECFQVSAVTFACALVSAKNYLLLRGLDEDFPRGFNDVDFGIRSADQKLTNIVCGRAHLTHAESVSRPKSSTLAGVVSGVWDVFVFLRKHPGSLVEKFFSN
jgi:GT2 family glycosyltransferase